MLNKTSNPSAIKLNTIYDKKLFGPTIVGIYQIKIIKPLIPNKYSKIIPKKGSKIHLKLTLFK